MKRGKGGCFSGSWLGAGIFWGNVLMPSLQYQTPLSWGKGGWVVHAFAKLKVWSNCQFRFQSQESEAF